MWACVKKIPSTDSLLLFDSYLVIIFICLPISGVASNKYVLLFSVSINPNDTTCLLLFGLSNRLAQHSFLQAICGDPASWAVPRITSDILLTV